MAAVSRRGVASVLLLTAACGGGSSNPTGPGPVSPPSPTAGVDIVVFYDENANGAIDASERVRIPMAEVSAGSRSARTTATGEARIEGVPQGSQSVTVRPESLPPYYVPPAAIAVTVPVPGDQRVPIPVTLALGRNRPNVYMAFGDSISAGEGSRDGTGYREFLAVDLRAYLGAATVVDEGLSGSRSNRGADRIGDSLNRQRPAYSLVLYGTNDWNVAECKTAPPCFTIDSLRTMIGLAKAASSLPVVATLPPVNPVAAPSERTAWVTAINTAIRTMVRQEGVVLADVAAGFARETDLPSLFVDHVHPNDRGYRIVATAFLEAISRPRGSAAAAAFGFSSPIG